MASTTHPISINSLTIQVIKPLFICYCNRAQEWLKKLLKIREALTVKWNGCVSSFSLLSLFQVKQGRCKKRVIDEMLHVVLLTLLLGLGTHLIGYILPRGVWGKEKEVMLSILHHGKSEVYCFHILRPIHILSGIWYLRTDTMEITVNNKTNRA